MTHVTALLVEIRGKHQLAALEPAFCELPCCLCCATEKNTVDMPVACYTDFAGLRLVH